MTTGLHLIMVKTSFSTTLLPNNSDYKSTSLSQIQNTQVSLSYDGTEMEFESVPYSLLSDWQQKQSKKVEGSIFFLGGVNYPLKVTSSKDNASKIAYSNCHTISHSQRKWRNMWCEGQSWVRYPTPITPWMYTDCVKPGESPHFSASISLSLKRRDQ